MTLEQAEAKAKEIATKFFYWWYNQRGNNTLEGFDYWAQTDEGQQLIQSLVNEKIIAQSERLCNAVHNYMDIYKSNNRHTKARRNAENILACVLYDTCKLIPGYEKNTMPQSLVSEGAGRWVKADVIELLKRIGKKGLYLNDDGTLWEDAFLNGTDVTDKTIDEIIAESPASPAAQDGNGWIAHFTNEQSFIDFLKWQKGEGK